MNFCIYLFLIFFWIKEKPANLMMSERICFVTNECSIFSPLWLPAPAIILIFIISQIYVLASFRKKVTIVSLTLIFKKIYSFYIRQQYMKIKTLLSDLKYNTVAKRRCTIYHPNECRHVHLFLWPIKIYYSWRACRRTYLCQSLSYWYQNQYTE